MSDKKPLTGTEAFTPVANPSDNPGTKTLEELKAFNASEARAFYDRIVTATHPILTSDKVE